MRSPFKNIRFIVTLALFLAVVTARAEKEETVVFVNDDLNGGVDDTFIVNAGPFAGGMSNFGKCPMIEVDRNTHFGLMRFDVSTLFGKYSKINSVTLRLFNQYDSSGEMSVIRLSSANSAWREGGNCGGTVIGGARHEVTWMHLVSHGGFPTKATWASGTPGPTKVGVDYYKEPLALVKSDSLTKDAKLDIDFEGDLDKLLNEWSRSSTVPGKTDRGGNPTWTPDWDWVQPAPRTTNEGIILMGINGKRKSFHSSDAPDRSLRPQLIVKYIPREGFSKPENSQPPNKPSLQRPGYSDTPMISGSKWKMHDPNRPYPTIVDPGPLLKQKGYPYKPPAGATILFDGKDLSKWNEVGGRGRWVVENGYFGVFGQHDNCFEALGLLGIPEEKFVKPKIPVRPRILQSHAKFKDFQLHLEWATPREVKGSRLGRANSGVLLLGVYEIQVLDSFENPSYADGQAASIYGQYPPESNVCRKPGDWQTFDITFRAPRFHLLEGSVFKNGKLKTPAKLTLLHNGVKVHDDRELLGETTHRTLPGYRRKITFGPIALQDYGSPIRFRNIWIKPL